MICSYVLTRRSSQRRAAGGEPGQAEGVEEWVAAALRDARVARLGTVDASGEVRLVPVCFAAVDGWLVSAVDHKPKRTGQLRRLDDIRRAGTATVLVDHYEEDWARLWWVRIRGRAEVLDGGDEHEGALATLGAKYRQYTEHPPSGAVWRVAMDELRWWRGGA
jgi:PPOX class probable F420-dependent enzyme